MTEAQAKLDRKRLTEIENRLGWDGSDKWPVSETVRLWAIAAERILDERDTAHAKLEIIVKICNSTKHLNQIDDILKACSQHTIQMSERSKE